MAVGTKTLHGIKRVPQWNHIARVNSIISGRSPPLHLYTYINHHVGTPKQKETSYLIIGLSVPN